VETRLRRDVRELLRRADARWVLPTGEGHHLVLAARGVGSTRPARDAQFVVGGLSGLRAYPVHALAGTDLVRLNAEERVLIARDIARVLSLGGTVFLDAARAWGAGAESTGWFTAAGAGLRIAPPRRLIGPILRVDVAWPVDPTRDGLREPVFSIGSSQAF
jgi:hemolysin activation/secretion protein